MKYSKSGEMYLNDNPTPQELLDFEAEELRFETNQILLRLQELDKIIPRCLEDNKKLLNFHSSVIDVISEKEELRLKLSKL